MAVTDDFSFPKLIPSTPTTTKNDNNNSKNDNKSPASHFTLSSPSLWRISSIVYPDDEYEQENDDHGDVVSTKNNTKSLLSEPEVDRDLEERMDSLWEDFNEQEVLVRPLQRVSSLDNNRKRKIIGSSRYINYYPSRSDDIIIDVFDERDRYCFDRTAGFARSDLDHDDDDDDDDDDYGHRGLKVKVPGRSSIDISNGTNTSSNLTRHRKRTSMVVLLKAFRKLFLLQNLARNKKN